MALSVSRGVCFFFFFLSLFFWFHIASAVNFRLSRTMLEADMANRNDMILRTVLDEDEYEQLLDLRNKAERLIDEGRYRISLFLCVCFASHYFSALVP
jgi:hypothetical protein